jgi:hypothetical protein
LRWEVIINTQKIFIRFNQLKFLASILNASNKLQNLLKTLKPKAHDMNKKQIEANNMQATNLAKKRQSHYILFYNVGLPSKFEIMERQFVQCHGPHTPMASPIVWY